MSPWEKVFIRRCVFYSREMTAHREFPHKKDGVDYDYDKPPSFSDRGDDAIVAKTFFWEIEQAGSNSTFFPLSELYTSKTGILPVLKIVLLCATTADTRTSCLF